MKFYIPSTHIIRVADTVEFISVVIPIPKTSSQDYLHQSITDILSLSWQTQIRLPLPLSFGDDTQNPVEQIATLLNHAIPAPNPIKTTITPIYPHPKSPSELTTKYPVLAPHPAPAPRVVSYTSSVPRVEVPSQPSPPKSDHKQISYRLLSSTKQSRSPNSQYIHLSWYHKYFTALA